MIFLAVLGALLLEQVRPMPYPNAAVRAIRALANWAAPYINAGMPKHGVWGWFALVVPLCVAVQGVCWLLADINVVLEWAWALVVLYFTMGFRQVSHYFTDIVRALRAGKWSDARAEIARWRQESQLEVEEGAVARLAIEEGLCAAHRFVFGPFFFAVLLGPVGAVLYRVSAILSECWSAKDRPELEHFARFAGTAFEWIDWLPSRLTATGFAVAGNFEDAFYCWRRQAPSWPNRLNGAILASGAGALGVRLGGPLRRLAYVEERPELGVADEPDVESLDGTIGLIWRATVMWLIVILVIALARLTG